MLIFSLVCADIKYISIAVHMYSFCTLSSKLALLIFPVLFCTTAGIPLPKREEAVGLGPARLVTVL